MESSDAPVAMRSPNVRRRTATGRVFGDLAVWMVGFGAGIGVLFPFAVIAFGVPAKTVLRPAFFVATVVAGLLVGAVNFVLAHRVVGARLRELSARMGYVSGVIAESMLTGDWSRCTPQECELAVDSADALGEAAASFNGLLHALSRSRRVEQAMAGFGDTLVRHLTVVDVAEAALAGFIEHSGAEAGALGVVRDGELVIEAAERLDGKFIERASAVHAALRHPAMTSILVPDGVVIDATLLSFRPGHLVVLPLQFKSVPVGVVVLAYVAPVPPQVVRLLENLGQACGVALNNALSHERLQHLVAIDPLTGIYNRRFGDARLREEWARTMRDGGPLGLISFDLDHFKAVNDTHGHLVGDLVLREAVAAARQAIREVDLFVRVGGDEFLVILPGAGGADVAAVAERIRTRIATAAVPAQDLRVRVTVSLAALSWPTAGLDVSGPDDLLTKLDEALYESKQSGRNTVTTAGPHTDPALAGRR